MSQARLFALQLLGNIIAPPVPHHAYALPPRIYRLGFTGPGRTKQSFKNECDINLIMKRYETSGVLQHIREGNPQYLDTTGFDYQDAMQRIAYARSVFEELPSSVRKRFENNPAKLLDFVHNPENLVESVQMGLVDPERLPKPLQEVARPTPTPKAVKPATGPQNPVSGDSAKPAP